MDEEIREEQISFLQKIKPFLHSALPQKEDIQQNNALTDIIEDKGIEIDESELDESVRQQTDVDDTQNNTTLNELIQRIERIEEMLGNQEEDGIRKTRVKEQIVSLLQQHRKLSSSQLSKLLGLSRTRCNEYFRELTKEGKTEGIIIDREKYYKLVRE